MCLRYIFIFGLLIGCSNFAAIEFYVSPTGNDQNPGTIEKPFATLEKARDSIREIKKQQSFLPDGATIYLRGGNYTLKNSFELTGLDGGIDNEAIVYQAYADETVRIIGGTLIPEAAIQKVTDPKVLDRLISVDAREHLSVVDLKTLGITDYGVVYPQRNLKAELFFKNRYLPLARYPNDGWLHIADVPQNGEKMINEGRTDWVIDGIPRGRHYGRFVYAEDRPKSWAQNSEIYAQGYWVYDWSEQIIRLDKIDKTTREVFPEQPHHGYGYQKDARYYFLNVFEEIDSPGEWYIDRLAGLLYLWLPEPVQDGDLMLPTLNEPMIKINDASFVTIRGLRFESSRSGGIEINSGHHALIAGCTFVNLGNSAVVINGGLSHGVQSCDIYNVSGAGIEITGGDRKTLTPCGHWADNNDIHHFSQVYRTYNPAIKMTGVGIKISHNYVHDAPHEGIEPNGNDFVLEYNEIARVCAETGDAGAIYTAADWTFCGMVIRHNYIHDIHGAGKYVDTRAVYLDLPVGGATLFGNIFYNLETAFFTNSGRNNLIDNNIFVKCRPAVAISVYREPDEFKPGGGWRLVEKLNDVNYKSPPYSLRYPWLSKVLSEGDDPAIPYGNVVTRNICFDGLWLDLHSELNFDLTRIENNLIASPELCIWRQAFQEQTKGGKTYPFGEPEMTKILKDNHNLMMNSNPGFENVEKQDFRLKPDSPALKLGFKPIPVEKIGLYMDEYRKQGPGK